MKQYTKLIVLFSLLSLLYLLQIFAIPADARSLNRYNLSGTEAKLIALSFAIPYIVIWFTALYGYIKLKGYSLSIIGNQEGKAFSMIANGLLVLAFWMPISTILTNLGTWISQRDPSLKPETTIISNYVTLGFTLLAFVLIYRGAQKLKPILKKYGTKIDYQSFFPELFVMASALFIYLTFTNDARTAPTENVPLATYYLPDALILITIVLPYIAVWYLGMNAARLIQIYRLRISGTLYKNALQNLARGVICVIISLISIRYLASMTSVFSDATLKFILLLVYALLIVIAIGYIFIAVGARRLKKIEEV